jgi:peptide/nickel transport system substrate-binding protein
MKRIFFLAMMVVGAALPAAAGLRYAEATAPTSLNPMLVADMPSLRATELMYEGLVTPPIAGEVEPALAESWQVAPDEKSVTFQLRRGVTWHDGKPVTSKDVFFTIMAGKDPRTATALGAQFEAFDKILTPNERTVVVNFKRKVLNPLLYFDFKILPAHRFPEGYVAAESAIESPVGSGPFQFTEWTHAGEIRFARNPSYKRDKGGVSIDEIEVSPVPDDNIRNELLRYGAVDLLPQVRPKDIPALEELTSVRLHPYSTLSYSYIGLNFRNPLIRNKLVRQALVSGLNREDMLKAHYGNRGTIISGPFPPASWAYNFDVKPWAYDARRAAALLDEAGAVDSNKDGVREWEGKPIVLRVVSLAQSEVQKAVVLDLQQQIKNLGLTADVRFMEPMAWKKAVFEDHDFDLVLAEWTFDNSVNIYTLFHSTQTGPNQNNFGGYSNPDVDRLLDESRDAANSEMLRAEYGELHKVLRDDLPYLFLWSLNRYAAISSRIDNVRLHPFYFFSYVAGWKEK